MFWYIFVLLEIALFIIKLKIILGKWNPNSIVSYFFNKTAWMTIKIFEEWLTDFNKRMKAENRNVILLVDNCWCK